VIADIETTRLARNKLFHSGFEACKNEGNGLTMILGNEIVRKYDN
jgi:hypothetical protein